jgi:hypothetical protein
MTFEFIGSGLNLTGKRQLSRGGGRERQLELQDMDNVIGCG